MNLFVETNQQVFFELLRAGLWEKETQLSRYNEVDYSEIMRLAEEQSVVGLVTAGLEHVSDVKVPQKVLLQYIGQTLQIEQQNKAMNEFVAKLIEKLRKEDVYAILVKGQGIAQCYEKPLWRASGDVDLFLDEANYRKAKDILTPLASAMEEEDKQRLHLGMTIDSWMVELHGTMRTAISRKVDDGIDAVQRSIFMNGEIREWKNGNSTINLPSAAADAIIVFTHFLQHFYVGGIGIRQICDWCRLLWAYRTEIDRKLLEKRLRSMHLMTEWKAFAAFAVKWLGMLVDEMPLYDDSKKYNRKADRISYLVLKAGNFGHNKDVSYRSKYSGLVRNVITFWRRFGEFMKVVAIFPDNAPRFFVNYVCGRMKAA